MRFGENKAFIIFEARHLKDAGLLFLDATSHQYIFAIHFGGLAQLARALAWHARGRRFDPDTLHNTGVHQVTE